MGTPLSIDVDLNANGLMGKEGVKDIGSFELAPYETITITAEALSMPILSSESVIEAVVEVTTSVDFENGIFESHELSNHFYYKHSKDFIQFMVGSANAVVNDLNGILSSSVLTNEQKLFGNVNAMDESLLAEKAEKIPLGIIVDDWENETPIFEAAEKLEVGGVFRGWITGQSIGTNEDENTDASLQTELQIKEIEEAAMPMGSRSGIKYQFCGNFKNVTYYDDHMGEDFLKASSAGFPAQYNRAQVYVRYGNYWTKVWPSWGFGLPEWGVLDSNGCMPESEALSSGADQYQMRIATWNSDADNNNDIYSLRHTGNFDISYKTYSTYYTPPPNMPYCNPIFEDCTWDISMKTYTTSREAHGSVFAGQIIRKRFQTGYASGSSDLETKLYFWDGSNEPCSGTYYNPGTSEVCISGGRYKLKFVMAHEAGHRVSDAKDGPMPGFLSGESGINQYFLGEESQASLLCRCDFMGDLCNDNDGMFCWHCLNSREGIKTAQGEGFAYHFATTAFNYQNTNARCVYSKPVYLSDNPDIVAQPPFAFTASTNVRRMENECNNIVTNNGTEWDWINFFANIWGKTPSGQSSSVRFSMTETMNIWDEVGSNSTWNNLMSEVSNIYGANSFERDHFSNSGWEAGVNH